MLRMMKAFDKVRIAPSLDLGHAGLVLAAVMLEEQFSRDAFLELAGYWWDLQHEVESPVPKSERAPLPESQGPLPLEQLEQSARNLGRTIADVLPKGVGFVLVLFDYARGGNMTYLSTGERPSTIAMLKELVTKMQEGSN
jgi:hypothetical protein